MNSTMNYYELLGVKQNATEDEIRLAYKKQMKKWHPDINKSPDAVNMSTKINEAKEVLLDSLKRSDYDEFLKQKINDDYAKYTRDKQARAYANNYHNTHEDKTEEYKDKKVTKWQYLKDWLKYANVSFLRKIIGAIGVLLESLLCFIIKILIIGIAFLCNTISDILKQFINYGAILFGLFAVFVISQIISNGFIETMKDSEYSSAIIAVLVILFSCFILPLISKMLLSAKTFDILYNKIDITLFKKCVGYND